MRVSCRQKVHGGEVNYLSVKKIVLETIVGKIKLERGHILKSI